MIWNTLEFVFRETALHLRRERLIAIATISTVAVLLLLLGAIVLFLLNLSVWSQRLAQQLEVRAYFQRDFPREEAQKAAQQIAAWPEVRSASFVTKEEGWEWLKKNVVSGAELQGLDNPLPDRVDVLAKDPEFAPEVARRLEKLPGVKDVVPSAASASQSGSFARRVVQAKRLVTWVAILASLLAAVAGALIVHNTVRLALHSRWREIYIMQLVGATRSLIAVPFLLEGMLHGAVGAALACCILVPAHMFLRNLTAHSAPFLLLAPNPTLLPFTLAVLAVGALLGLTGSAFSVRRYLRQKPEWQG